MRRLGLLGRIFAATWLIAATAWAQSAQIQGRLVDDQGGAVPGVEVSALDEEKGVVARQTTSGADGFFTLSSLLRGRYTVRAELSGFKPLEQRGLVLDPGSGAGSARREADGRRPDGNASRSASERRSSRSAPARSPTRFRTRRSAS